MNADKIVVGLAGMPGSGKSLVVETARELGYAIVVMGDVIREETIKRGLELTPQNVGKVMLQLRADRRKRCGRSEMHSQNRRTSKQQSSC